MRRHFLRAAALLVGALSVWWGGVLLLNATVFSAENYLSDYLDALESGDRESAAALAGWDSPVLPVVSQSIAEPSVTGVRQIDSSTVELHATFVVAGERAGAVFTLAKASALLGVFHQWSFATPPVTVIDVDSDWTGPVLVGGVEAGNTGTVEVLVPGVYSIESGTPWVRYSPTSFQVNQPGDEHLLTVSALPTPALEGELEEAVSDYLDNCIAQGVLQPSSCPFGITIIDRVVGSPEWRISQVPRLMMRPDELGKNWLVLGKGGVATFSADVQSLFDGSIDRYTEPQEFDISGVITGVESVSPEFRID